MTKIKRLSRKISRIRKNEAGSGQFSGLIRPTNYVFVNSICLPIVNR